MELKELIEHILILSAQDTTNVLDTFLALSEEVGEIATALAVETGYKNKTITESSADESIDCIISALAIISKNPDYTVEKITAVMAKKVKKWHNSVKARSKK